jgi:hypothetical protein
MVCLFAGSIFAILFLLKKKVLWAFFVSVALFLGALLSWILHMSFILDIRW